MNNKFYKKDDICIVGIGNILPDANNPEEFWDNIIKEKSSVREVDSGRWDPSIYFSLDRLKPDKTYSKNAAFISDEQINIINSKLRTSDYRNRLQLFTEVAVSQAVDCLNQDSLKNAKNKTSVVLGCMENGEYLSSEKFFLSNKNLLLKYIKKNKIDNGEEIIKKIKKHYNKVNYSRDDLMGSVFINSIIAKIKKKYNFKGEGFLVDAACASSLSAIKASIDMLKEGSTDLVITGGIEANLSPETFVLFSKIGAMASDKCSPFDIGSDGLNQGEGAVIFVLQRLSDAVKDNNNIYGVIKSIGGSSDGRSASVFSPSSKGQIEAFKEAYKNIDLKSINYIECHGTGTKKGDITEVESLNTFFNGCNIPIGSVKSLIGHTKGAAGASGLLKSLLMIKNRKMPPTKYLKKFVGKKKSSVYVNKSLISLPDSNICIGVSSFGFGNINYHLVVEEFNENIKIIDKDRINNNQVVFIGKEFFQPENIDKAILIKKFKIPVKSLEQIDNVQLQALMATDKVLSSNNIQIEKIDKKRVVVISAGAIGLEASIKLSQRLMCHELKRALNDFDDGLVKKLIEFREIYPPVTEDTGPGILNNVTSGRVCNFFDFKGENFNVDSDFNSYYSALNIAYRKLQKWDGLIVLLHNEEEIRGDKIGLRKRGMRCVLLSSLEFAKKNDLPINKVIKKIDYYDC